MKLAKRAGVLTAISLTLIGCDQATKSLAATHLPRGNMLPYFNDLIRVGYTENTGAFLGLGSDLPPEWRFWIFVVATGLLLAGLVAYLLTQLSGFTFAAIGLSLMAPLLRRPPTWSIGCPHHHRPHRRRDPPGLSLSRRRAA